MKSQAIIFVLFCAWQITAGKRLKMYPSREERIVGGNPAKEGEAPYQCSMQSYNFHFCGCSIVNKGWAVTAAHCVEDQNPSSLEILVGTTDLNKGGVRYKVSALYHHSRHNQPSFANDIALIRINGTVQFNKLVQPIEYSPYVVPVNTTLQLTGWGDGAVHSNELQIIKLKSISNEQCSAAYGADSDVDIGHICTLTKKGEGACNGDSGGPLTLNGKLVGVVNFGVPCAQGFPDAYARVSYYHDWLRTTINSNQ